VGSNLILPLGAKLTLEPLNIVKECKFGCKSYRQLVIVPFTEKLLAGIILSRTCTA
jgi:hypothetical protein